MNRRTAMLALAFLADVVFDTGWNLYAEEKQAYAVWDHDALKVTRNTEAFAPLVNGQPDMKQAKVRNLQFDMDRYKIRIGL